MPVGIRTSYITTQNEVWATDTVFRSVGLVSPIAANETQSIWLIANNTTTAAAGIPKVQVLMPAGVVYFIGSRLQYNPTSGIVGPLVMTSGNSFFFSGSGQNREIEMNLFIINGPTAGVIDIQFAQNTLAGGTFTLRRGATIEVTIL